MTWRIMTKKSNPPGTPDIYRTFVKEDWDQVDRFIRSQLGKPKSPIKVLRIVSSEAVYLVGNGEGIGE
jgi:hypothetical protein